MSRRAFLSAPFDVEAGPLVRALAERGWEVYVLSDVAELGASLSDSVVSAINAAEVVIAVFPSGAVSPNTAFEAGIAFGLGKPVLSVVGQGAEVPTDLRSSLYVQASLDNVEAIALALKNIDRPRPQRSTPSKLRAGRPLGAYADDLLVRANALRQMRGSGREIEDLVVRAIEASGAVAVPSTGADRGFDIGVWADDLDAIAGNPLLIEVKRRFNRAAVDQSLAALGRVPGARAALLISLDDSPPPANANLRWPVFWISLTDLLHQMKTASFAEVFRLLRNRSVHGESG